MNNKEISHFVMLGINYYYRGNKYIKDANYTGQGRRFVKEGSTDAIIVSPNVSLDNAGISMVRHCYPVFKKK